MHAEVYSWVRQGVPAMPKGTLGQLVDIDKKGAWGPRPLGEGHSINSTAGALHAHSVIVECGPGCKVNIAQ